MCFRIYGNEDYSGVAVGHCFLISSNSSKAESIEFSSHFHWPSHDLFAHFADNCGNVNNTSGSSASGFLGSPGYNMDDILIITAKHSERAYLRATFLKNHFDKITKQRGRKPFKWVNNSLIIKKKNSFFLLWLTYLASIYPFQFSAHQNWRWSLQRGDCPQVSKHSFADCDPLSRTFGPSS